ncbi:MAG TPA: DUF1552 domain-containing protein [Bryobacteraceae bacterium]|nr:DUF1552 domain-containing protein [Bryobacteraceae bacterium]
MIITKKALPRRTFLRGMGVTVALPLLDAMVPALRGATTASPVSRLAFFYVPNGMILPNFHPAATGTNFEFTPVLKPLEPFREHVTVLSGLSNLGVLSPNEGGGVHTRAHAGWLNGVLAKRTEGSDITTGKTIDQYAADKLGADTPLRSLELTTESNYLVGNCENGYSCSYMNSTSWQTPTTPLPHERDPRVVFERLFGDGGSVSAQTAQMKKDRSILDSVSEDMRRIERRLGAGDRRMVSDYLDAVREIETRIQKSEKNNAASPLPALAQPAGIPEEFDDHVKLMLDLLHLALQGEITRVACFQIARELSARSYPWIGVPESHHLISHHQNDPHNMAQKTKIDAHHMALFAGLVEKMRATPDGDGTLLDHSILVYGGGMGDGDKHTPIDLPVTIVGRGCGTLKGGRHIRYEMNTPFMNAGLTLLDKLGVQADKIGDSTGKLVDL